jgi:hypothetical protein
MYTTIDDALRQLPFQQGAGGGEQPRRKSTRTDKPLRLHCSRVESHFAIVRTKRGKKTISRHDQDFAFEPNLTTSAASVATNST